MLLLLLCGGKNSFITRSFEIWNWSNHFSFWDYLNPFWKGILTISMNENIFDKCYKWLILINTLVKKQIIILKKVTSLVFRSAICNHKFCNRDVRIYDWIVYNLANNFLLLYFLSWTNISKIKFIINIPCALYSNVKYDYSFYACSPTASQKLESVQLFIASKSIPILLSCIMTYNNYKLLVVYINGDFGGNYFFMGILLDLMHQPSTDVPPILTVIF